MQQHSLKMLIEHYRATFCNSNYFYESHKNFLQANYERSLFGFVEIPIIINDYGTNWRQKNQELCWEQLRHKKFQRFCSS